MLMMLLKILLLFLLAVFLLLLLLLLLVLFVPLRYSLDLERREAAEGHAHFSLHWFLRLVELRGGYDRNGFRYQLRALRYTIKETDQDEQS